MYAWNISPFCMTKLNKQSVFEEINHPSHVSIPKGK